MGLQAATRKALAVKVLSTKVCEALCGLMAVLDDIREMPPDRAVREVLARCGYREHLQRYTRSHPSQPGIRRSVSQFGQLLQGTVKPPQSVFG